MEIEAAEKYIITAKEILKKLGSTKKPSIDFIPEKEVKVAKRRGRKPKSVSTEELPKPPKDVPVILEKKRKSTSKLKKAPKTKIEPSVKNAPDSKPAKIIPKPTKVEKPIVKKKRANKRPRKGVFLTPLSKPLKKKESLNEVQTESAPPSEPPSQ